MMRSPHRDDDALPNVSVVPWNQIDSLEFAYTLTGSRIIQDLF